MFKRKIDKDDGWDSVSYYDVVTMPSGQRIKIEFQEECSSKKWYYNIYLVTMDKRKSEHNTFQKTTGMDGLSGLLWAKEKIIEFEQWISTEKPNVPIIIYCYWTDGRRRDVYFRGLKNIGYTFGMLFNSKVLFKQLAV